MLLPFAVRMRPYIINKKKTARTYYSTVTAAYLPDSIPRSFRVYILEIYRQDSRIVAGG